MGTQNWGVRGGGGGVNKVHSGQFENGELKNTVNRKHIWSYFITIKIPWSISQFHFVKQRQSTRVYLGQSQKRQMIRWTNRNSSGCRDCNASAGKHLRATSNDWFLFHSWLVMKEARDFQPMKSSAKLDKFSTVILSTLNCLNYTALDTQQHFTKQKISRCQYSRNLHSIESKS